MSDRSEILRKRYTWLKAFNDDELREISFCADPGDELSEGEVYFDLGKPERGVIRASKGERVPEGSCYVSKSSLSKHLWEKLTRSFEKQ